MNVEQLIEKFKSLGERYKCLKVSLENKNEDAMSIALFVDSNNIPAVMVAESETVNAEKYRDELMGELETWSRGRSGFGMESDVYAIFTYEYDNGNYDFRYHEIKDVCSGLGFLLLIAQEAENIELREHFDSFDDDLFDD